MREGHGLGDLRAVTGSLDAVDGVSLEDVPQRDSVDELHHRVDTLAVAADIENSGDILVGKRHGRPGFALEPEGGVRIPRQLRGEYFQRHFGVRSPVLRPEDVGEKSSSQRRTDLVWA